MLELIWVKELIEKIMTFRIKINYLDMNKVYKHLGVKLLKILILIK